MSVGCRLTAPRGWRCAGAVDSPATPRLSHGLGSGAHHRSASSFSRNMDEVLFTEMDKVRRGVTAGPHHDLHHRLPVRSNFAGLEPLHLIRVLSAAASACPQCSMNNDVSPWTTMYHK